MIFFMVKSDLCFEKNLEMGRITVMVTPGRIPTLHYVLVFFNQFRPKVDVSESENKKG